MITRRSSSSLTNLATEIVVQSEMALLHTVSCSFQIIISVLTVIDGFDGSSKLFLLEFSMPSSGKTGFNADMPAAWILNAEVPRTLQYGDCSCWKSGCGEFDVFEVLNSGNQKAISAWHGLRSKGDSNWFHRPIDKTMKAAVILDGTSSTAHIVVLPDDTNFDTSLGDSVVTSFLNSVTDPLQSIKVALP